MITNIISIIDELKAERTAGDEMAADLVERIDSHIRDLQTLRAWVIDSAAVRSQAIAGMLGGDVVAVVPADEDAPAPATAPPQTADAA